MAPSSKASLKFDRKFMCQWPYGILKFLQWLVPLILAITLNYAPQILKEKHLCSGVADVQSMATHAFWYSFVTWVLYCYGVQRSVFPTLEGKLFAPFAWIEYIASLLFVINFFHIIYEIGKCVNESVKSSDRWEIILLYSLAIFFYLLCIFNYFTFAILIHKNSSKAESKKISSIIIEGNKIQTVDSIYASNFLNSNVKNTFHSPVVVSQ